MTDQEIKRINELYHKSKSCGLTASEKEEQMQLRKAYISSVKLDLQSTLNNIHIQEADGSIVELRQSNDK